VTRVNPLGKEALPDDLHKLWDDFTGSDRNFTNQAEVLAHSPQAFRHLYGLVAALRSNSGLSDRLIEIAVVTTSKLNECPYCVAHHEHALHKTGLSAQSIKAILEPEVPGFSDVELAVRDYAKLVVERSWGIAQSFHDRLRQHFNEQQVVELTVRIGLCILFNKFNQALDIPVEDSVQLAATEAT